MGKPPPADDAGTFRHRLWLVAMTGWFFYPITFALLCLVVFGLLKLAWWVFGL